ncbi:MAG: hypothetical protein QOE52_4880, partial [Mycobacterium sp.]|nr:hypothetical protein [Mycobacterium sp.]
MTTTREAGPSPADSAASQHSDPGRSRPQSAPTAPTGVWPLILRGWRDAPRVVWLARAGILFTIL